MVNTFGGDRRHFMRSAVVALGAAHMGILNSLELEGASRELSAITRASVWLNSPPLTADALAGKVVLVQFCTYTCINWLRTLPYVRAWAAKYKERLIVIGLHTPEFPFEHNVENVRRSARQMTIDYPIAVDNNYEIWRAFNNQYWPALYVIDSRGRIRYHHFGEGAYEQSERMIQRLLVEAGAATREQGLVQVHPVGVEAPASWGDLRSPENYVGYRRTENFVSPGAVKRDRSRRYEAPSRFALNQWALVGEWTIGSQAVVSNMPGARIVNRFHARDLHLVMGPSQPGSRLRFRVTIDDRPPGRASGVDVDEGGDGTILDQRLYQLIRQPEPIVDRQFAIEFLDGGCEAYAFTFG